MSTLHSTAIKEFKENDRVLSDLEKQKIIDIGDEYKSLWNELSANLQKWLFATLITVNLGGMAFAINSQIHPVAVEYAVKSFFGGLAAALLAGLLELFRIRRMQDIVYQLKNGIFENGKATTVREVKNIFSEWYRSFIPLFFAVISLGAFFFGGSALIEGTRRCSTEMFEYADRNNTNEHPAGGKATTRCYYYEIDGMPSDPLERARFEEKLMKIMKDKNIVFE